MSGLAPGKRGVPPPHRTPPIHFLSLCGCVKRGVFELLLMVKRRKKPTTREKFFPTRCPIDRLMAMLELFSTSTSSKPSRKRHHHDSDTPLLPRADLDANLRSLPAWRLSPDGTSLSREFKTKNFMSAVAFLAAAAEVAEAAGHHPDFHLTEWNRVRVDATTHAVGGITLADVSLAAKLDAVPVVYSPKWLREQAAAAAKEEEGKE